MPPMHMKLGGGGGFSKRALREGHGGRGPTGSGVGPLEQTVPEAVRQAAAGVIPTDAKLRLSIPTDMRPDGDFGREWLLLDDATLAIVQASDDTEAATATLRWHLPVAAIQDVQTVNHVGSGALELRDSTGVQLLLRYTNADRRVFSAAAGLVRIWAKEGLWEPEKIDLGWRACETCGERLQEGSSVCPKCLDKRQQLVKVLAYLKPYKGQVVLMMCIMVSSSLVGLIAPMIGKTMVDDVLMPLAHREWLVPLVLAMVATQLAGTVLDGWNSVVAARIGSNAVHDIRSAMFGKLQELSLNFYAHHKVGALIARVNQDTGQLQRLLVDFIPYGISSVITSVAILCLLFSLSWQLTLVVLVPVIGMVVFARVVLPRFRRYFDRFMEKRSRLSALVSDVLNGVRVVKAFGRGSEEAKRFDKQSAEFRDAAITAETAMAKVMPVFHAVAQVGGPIVWLIGGILAFRGEMTLGEITAYLGYLMMLYRPVFVMTRLAQMIPNALSAASRVFEVMESEPDVAEAPDAIAMPEIEGRIELRGVTFGYEPHKPVLNDVSVSIKAGEMVGLVGHSGAGKSTTINVICRLYDPQEGQVLVDGVDVRKIRQADLRKHVGMVLQETFLLSGSIADNITYARPVADPLDIIRAARSANAHDFIAGKPDGYDTQVTDGGGNLSVGEKQRISIARAVLCDPKILILDEATASVDLETEKQIQEALQRLTSTRTTIAIAHRLTTLKNADRLVVMDKGKVEDMGTHDELLSREGTYKRLVNLHREMAELRGVAE